MKICFTKKIIFIFCCLGFHLVQAQFIFRATKPISWTHTTFIDKNETIHLKDTLPYSGVRIIDSRYDTTRIGYCGKGYLGLQGPGQASAIQNIINSYYAPLFTPGKDTLLIQLNKLSIQEGLKPGSGKMTRWPVNLVAGAATTEYTGSNNHFTFFAKLDTIMCENTPGSEYEINKKGKYRLNFELWDYYLLRLCEAMLTAPLQENSNTEAAENKKTFSIDELTGEGLQKRKVPILTDTFFRAGFYQTFGEFLNNQPSVACSDINQLNVMLDSMRYRLDEKKITIYLPDTCIWGFCDGSKIFIRIRYNLFEIERNDASFSMSATLDAFRRESNADGWNGLIGLTTLGLSVASVASGQGGDIMFVDNMIKTPKIPIAFIPAPTADEDLYATGVQLDIETGKITY